MHAELAARVHAELAAQEHAEVAAQEHAEVAAQKHAEFWTLQVDEFVIEMSRNAELGEVFAGDLVSYQLCEGPFLVVKVALVGL